jgi:hypothetical protein
VLTGAVSLNSYDMVGATPGKKPEKLRKKNFPPGFVQILGNKNFSPGFLRIFSWKKNTSNSWGIGIYIYN